MKTTSLYRPVNKVELDLIADLNWKGFPPRLADQPIFYPVMNQEYASQITVEWNLPSYKNGFVTKFEVDSDYLSKFKVEKVGLDHFLELWVPSEDLEEFNDHIIGKIEVVEAYSSIKNAQYVHVQNILELANIGFTASILYFPPNDGVTLSDFPKLGAVDIKKEFVLIRTSDQEGNRIPNMRIVKLKNKSDAAKLKEGYFYLLE